MMATKRKPKLPVDPAINTPTWTPAELKEFDEITWELGDRHPSVRIVARMTKMPAFVEKHGKEKCDAMFAHLQALDAAKKKK